MNIDTRNIIFKSLSEEQMNDVLLKMEDMAQKKLKNIEELYLSKMSKSDFPGETLALINNGDWQNFLPVEYNVIKKRLNESTKNRKTA